LSPKPKLRSPHLCSPGSPPSPRSPPWKEEREDGKEKKKPSPLLIPPASGTFPSSCSLLRWWSEARLADLRWGGTSKQMSEIRVGCGFPSRNRN
ncbi:hypothetical protein LINPERHAP1_LOCUS36402, partial [Linum perenne]